jgi:Peptidase family M1 domain
VTKVLLRTLGLAAGMASLLPGCILPFSHALAGGQQAAPGKSGEALYLQLSQVGLDPLRVFKVRDASIDRSAVHISLEDGTIAFTKDVMGRITGAFFEGEGEILLAPPNQLERQSMSRFTGMAILEERFSTAYFRFNDDTAGQLQPGLRAPEDAAAFISRWNQTAQNLAPVDAMRLMVDFASLLPSDSSSAHDDSTHPPSIGQDRLLHARLLGSKLGIFDVYFDSNADEQIQAGQTKTAINGATYHDVWTSFSPDSSGSEKNLGEADKGDAEKRHDPIVVRHYSIDTVVKPPKQIHAEARLQVEISQPEVRILLFELSRFLQIETVEADGRALEFIHNPAMEGTQLARQGNDLVAVILPEATRPGEKLELRFVYGGEVLAEAGRGLLYVGARGTWYPNRGMAMSDFDLKFHYPPGWTLVATGKPDASYAAAASGGLLAGRWLSERPIPFAGFNLGRYRVASAMAGSVKVEAYATPTVEKDFPTSAPMEIITPIPSIAAPRAGVRVVPGSDPSPAHMASAVAETAARALDYYSARFGPYPYSQLSLTQMPGPESQGWPGLVYLSSYAFLTDQERADLHFDAFRRLLEQQTPAHEAAHQWWGDLVIWTTYRDQWISEGLANYSALMMLEESNPAGFRTVMNQYRNDLVKKNLDDDEAPKDAGPVTLGMRLFSSRSPEGYSAISYGRGTWLFHMLRSMLLDGQTPSGGRAISGPDEPFARSLHKLRQRYEGKSISTREMLDVFAEDLPPSLRYEGKKSLDWFWKDWVNGTALPKLELKTVKLTPQGTSLLATGTIVQKEISDELVTSVPVYAVVTGKTAVFLGRVFADGEESTFRLTAPAGTHKLLLDPNETILTAPK